MRLSPNTRAYPANVVPMGSNVSLPVETIDWSDTLAMTMNHIG